MENGVDTFLKILGNILDAGFNIGFLFLIIYIFKKKKKINLKPPAENTLAQSEKLVPANQPKEEFPGSNAPGTGQPTVPAPGSSGSKIVDAFFSAITKINEATNAVQPIENVPALNLRGGLQVLLQTKPVAPLDPKKKYLQIALNGTMEDARQILSNLPQSDRILVEAGTPLIKKYGLRAIREIKSYLPGMYIVADLKTADLGEREAEQAARAGANGAVCLGVAPIDVINNFVAACKKFKIDAMIDMMNVSDPLMVLKQLKSQPQVVILHRGVDETETDRAKMIPYYQINKIKGNFKTMVAVAGGDSVRDVQSAFLSSADIVVLWKQFYKFEGDIAGLAKEFLQQVK